MHFQEISHSRKETGRIFRCSPRSLNRWIDKHNSTGHIKRCNRPSVAYKVTTIHADFAKQYVVANQTVSMRELCDIIVDRFQDLRVTPQHIGTVIRDQNLTRKRTRHGHFPHQRRNQPVDRRAELRAFYNVTNGHRIDKIISIDETSLSPFMFRPYGRSEIGNRCMQRTSNNKVFTKHTFIAGITNSKILGWELYAKGGSDTARFSAFLTKLIDTHHLRGYLFVGLCRGVYFKL
jgi:hypothetical protein